MMNSCVFLDRDGVINVRPKGRYVLDVSEFQILPGILSVLELIRERNHSMVVVTNQSGVARGVMTMEKLKAINRCMEERLAEAGIELLDVFVCPSADDTCEDRKPNPGMLLKAAEKHQLNLSESWMVGDQEGDIMAGKRAGCRTILMAEDAVETMADHRVANTAELKDLLAKTL